MAVPFFCALMQAEVKAHFETCPECRRALAAILDGMPLAFKMFMPAETVEAIKRLVEGGTDGNTQSH